MEHAMEHVAELCMIGAFGQAAHQLFGELEHCQEAIKTSQPTRVCLHTHPGAHLHTC